MSDFRLGSVLGFEIRIDFSWFVIFLLILWSFSAGVFPARYPGFATGTYLTMGTIGALLFFCSLLAHELAHSLVARAKGIPVEGITLFIFGGMARTKVEAREPGDEFAIAVVGPLSSLLIAGLFACVWWSGGRVGWTAVSGVARYLAFLNVLLAAFNLLPGFPLDGGRLFRSLVWKITGDLTKATRWASAGGRLLAYLLIGLGVLQLFTGAALGGLWLIFIGWFLRNAAMMSLQQHVVRHVLEGVSAREIMSPRPVSVSPDLTLSDLVESYLLEERHHSFPVVERGRPVGLVTLQHVKQVPREEWTTRLVRDVMTGMDAITVGPQDDVTELLERMQTADERRVLVVAEGVLLGIISASDVAGWIQRSQELESLHGCRRAVQEK
jgi:Zn-dependent protease